MTLLIIFAVIFATIIFAIVLERIIHCPILVGFAFFAAFLIVAAVFDSVALVIVAIALGILAFIVAFLDCIFRHSRFFRNNKCLTCECRNNSNETFTILNSNGRVVARNSGNNITCIDNNDNNCECGCNNGCNNSGVNLISDNGNILTTSDNSSCGCGRNNRYRRY